MNVAVHPLDGLNLISLCTGGGGLDLGVELAIPAARAVVMVEREAFACAHLVAAMRSGLMAPAALWSDARTFRGRAWRGLVDGVIGGIPCQPHSLAGKRLGEEDERDLWSDARRILVQSGAWFVLIENVGGMLSSGGAERVWRDLRRLGFQVEGGLVRASDVGASHERERLFILGVADRDGQYGDGRWIVGPRRRRQSSNEGIELADAGRARSQRTQFSRPPRSGDGSEASGSAPELCGASVGDAECGGFDRYDRGRSGAESAHRHFAMVNAIGVGRDGRPYEPERRPEERASFEQPSKGRVANLADAHVVEFRQEPSTGQLAVLQQNDGDGRRPIFPPGPSDIDGWRAILDRAPELEPALCRMADGLASALDVGRIDRLRMLGNGVVPLQAGYAVRTLATRLASRSTGAARLVRMMGEPE